MSLEGWIWTNEKKKKMISVEAELNILSSEQIWLTEADYILMVIFRKYRKISNIRHTKSPNLNVSRLGLQLSLHNILKPSVGRRMKM